MTLFSYKKEEMFQEHSTLATPTARLELGRDRPRRSARTAETDHPREGVANVWPRRKRVRRFALACPGLSRRRALAGGADRLLTKPIDFAVLRKEIDARLAGAG